ncbi:DUF6069 family protein [Nocardioides sp. B-3]|uniref:DUF6069 family protein n=1 Tax=Nocardioides sp. B-3 TaxID=2895565 RepID=UPI002152B79D|nr:DUF6069 family protein [Nocardioides sp. B-3]UUZ61036.1 DUF6069 family protein [Nocardioides sp. B-3]
MLAAVATESFTAVVRFAGVDLAVGDPGGHASSVVPVTAGACAISIAFCMVLGTALVAGIKRWATNPARVWWAVASVPVLASLIAPADRRGNQCAHEGNAGRGAPHRRRGHRPHARPSTGCRALKRNEHDHPAHPGHPRPPTKEHIMGYIKSSLFISLDGVIESP